MDVAEILRAQARALRKQAELLGASDTDGEPLELDSEKVRDFLIFFGGSNARQ